MTTATSSTPKAIELYKGDCLEEMKKIPNKSIDLILCDLPYQMTGMKWDSLIDLDKLWEQYNRILGDRGNIVLFCAGMFTYKLIQSNLKNYRYKLIWKKNVPTGMASAKYRPMKYYEEIVVFNRGTHATYNPILKERVGVGKDCYNYDHYCGKNNHIRVDKQARRYDPDFVQPSDILEFNVVPNRRGKLHPTQKPTELCEYLIKTYSNEGDVVLDNCMGSGTTGVACKNLTRRFIGIEMNDKYFEIAKERIENEVI